MGRVATNESPFASKPVKSVITFVFKSTADIAASSRVRAVVGNRIKFGLRVEASADKVEAYVSA